MKSCTDGMFTQTLRGRDGDDQDHESDRQQPQQVEPPATSDADAGRDAARDGTEPAHVVGSTTSSPTVSCERKLATTSGVTPASGALLRSVIRARYVPGAQALPAGSDNGRRLG